MPSAASFNAGGLKVLNVGKPGAGKSGALVDVLIADPEARAFICNFDRGNFATMVGVAQRDPKTGEARPPAVTERILTRQLFYHNFVDKIDFVNGIIQITGAPTAWTDVGKRLKNWGEPFPEATAANPKAGDINQLGPKDWLGFDSVSAMGDAALRYSLFNAGRINRRPEQSDWGDAINRLSMFFEMFNDPTLPFNVYATTHVRFVGDREAGEDAKGKPNELDMVPNALGQKLPQEIGRYFNNILETRTIGDGPGSRRMIYTRPPGGLQLRSSNPGAVKPEYELYGGLAKWLADIRSPAVPGASAPQPAAAAASN